MAAMKILADVSGSVWKVRVQAGDAVAEGDELFVLESMKMEIPVTAPAAGTVKTVAVAESDTIEENQLLATIEAEER